MDDITGVHILDRIDQLIHDEALVYVLEDVALFDDIVQIAVHELEDQIEVQIVCSSAMKKLKEHQ